MTMKKRRFLGILLMLVIVMVLIMGLSLISYADGVTEVSTADQFKIAVRNGGSVKLNGDFELSPDAGDKIEFRSTMTLDLNGHTITSNETGYHSEWEIYAPLTIKDGAEAGGGKIIHNEDSYTIVINNEGSLTLEGGTLEFPDNNNQGIDVYVGPFTMTGGTINSNKYSIRRDGNKVTISGGTVIGVFQDSSGDIEITGGKFSFDPTDLLSEGYTAPKEGDYWVVKKAAAVTKAPTAKTLTYDGNAHELVTAGEAKNGTMNYALGKDTETAPTEGWSESIPTGTNAETYYVWYKAKGSSNYSDSKPGVVSVTIKEKTAAHTHELKHVDAKEPTCEEDGYEAHYECTVEGCGEWFADDTGSVPIDKETFIKKATGHKWDKGVVTQEATYDETGIKTYSCTKCNATKEETIPKKTRSYSDSSDSSSDSDGGSGSSGNKSGNISTRSIDINGNVIQTQADSGAHVSDRGGNWGNENLSWTYTKSDGNLAKSEWLNLEYNGHTYWYYFDDSTIMQTDWFNYNGATYYFVPEMDGWRGRMATGWQQIGDRWYYFEPTLGASQGQMYRGAMTPDGHVVGADGAWDGNGTAPVGAIHTGTAVIGS